MHTSLRFAQVWTEAAEIAECGDTTKRAQLVAAFRSTHGASFAEIGVSVAEIDRIRVECEKAAVEGTAPRVEVACGTEAGGK